MAFVFNSAVDGPNGIYSMTQDPFIGKVWSWVEPR